MDFQLAPQQPLRSMPAVTSRSAGTLEALIRARAEASSDSVFVVHAGKQVTYGEQLAAAEHAAAALASLGVAKGDKIALMLPNCLEFLDLWFGCSLLGAVLVPVNTGLKGEGLEYIVRHSEASVAVVDESVADAYDAALGASPGIRRFVRGNADGWKPVAELLAGAHAPAPRVALEPGDLASVLYTSGTTGLPKGVMNCHSAYVTAAREFTERQVRVRSDDVFYTSLPLFHVNAQMLTTVGSLFSGRPMALAERFSASRFFDELRQHEATIFNYIGAMLTMVYKQPLRPDDTDHRVRLAIGGAAPKEVWSAFEERFGLTILEIYGLTETATYCLGNPPGDIRLGTLGTAVSWAEVMIRREDGTEAAPQEPGEITIRSKRPNVLFKGYYKNPEATTAAMLDGGWFRSGDRGLKREDGYHVFLDRMKDCIRRRGENISSYEVERIVNSHPSVAESAAVGVPSELGEEEVMVVVVPRAGVAPDPAELIAFCSERMANFMIPRYVKVRDALPKTATERVQKFELRAEGIGDAWDSAAIGAV
jgi:crotonobetaine/carnitine-CoA ligase